MPPFGVKAVIRLLRAFKPFDLPLRVLLNARIADLSPLIVLGAPGFRPSSFTPSYYDGLHQINGTKPD